jgi:hypothetical protein
LAEEPVRAEPGGRGNHTHGRRVTAPGIACSWIPVFTGMTRGERN